MNLIVEEQTALAILLAYPEQNRWELDGLEADLFAEPVHRLIARALCEVRDSGRRVHWRRVAGELKRRGHACHADVRRLVGAIGTKAGLTLAVSRLHKAREDRRVRRAA